MPKRPLEELVKQFTQNPKEFEKLQVELLESNYEEDELKDIYLAFIQIDPNVIAAIPENLRTRDMYFAVMQNTKMQETPALLDTISLEAFSKFHPDIVLEYLPVHLRTYDRCLAALVADVNSLAFLKKPSNRNSLTSDEYKTLCDIAIAAQTDGLLYHLQDIDPGVLTYETYLEAINANQASLAIIAHLDRPNITEAQFDELCSIAVAKYGINNVFPHLPKDKMTRDICLEALRQDPMLLQFVDAAMKADLITSYGAAKLLAMNYAAKQFFPEKPDFSQEISVFLKGIEYVVVTGYSVDKYPEIQDTYLAYIHANKRAGKAVYVRSDNIQMLMDDMAKAGGKQPINLVLVDEVGSASIAMAGFDTDTLATFLEANTTVSRVTMLGCNTAKHVARLENEERIVNEYHARKKQFENTNKNGLILISGPVDTKNYSRYLKDKDINGIYLITREADNYTLIFIRKDPTDNIVEEKYPINKQAVHDILNQVKTAKGKAIEFPDKTPAVSIIHNELGRKLTFRENQHFLSVLPVKPGEAKKPKEIFLRNVVAKEGEEAKFGESLLRKFSRAIKLTRVVEIKGYTGVVSGDTKNLKMRVIPAASLHTQDYRTAKKAMFFKSTDIIDRKKEATELNTLQRDLDEGTKSTMAKSITVRTQLKK